MKANKGEWSELYAFLKILGDGKIYAADENLNKISSLFYTLIKIIRDENGKTLEYFSDSNIKIIDTAGNVLITLPVKDFQEKSLELLKIIKSKNGSSFSVPEIENFMKKIYCKKIKAPSSEKRDITLVVKDLEVGAEKELGFSIKSQLGNPSTLLNSSQSTNIVYEIEGISTDEFLEINNLNPKKGKVKDRLKRIEELGGVFNFRRLKEPIFNKNLEIIDSSFPVILAALVYNFFKGGNNKVSDLTKEIIKENPLKISDENSENFYSKKIQHFLRNIAIGMTPKHTWDTMNEVTGGFLVVKEDGEVLCYHIYNKDSFESYLFNDTKFDTPSTTRHKFANLYEENGKIYFNLNFQVRFIK